jgi:GNAT superfamily N-acetyltransferase
MSNDPVSSILPRQAVTDEEIENCFDVMSELRTHLERQEFLAMVRHMENEGYRLAYLEDENRVVAVAGYRVYTNLFMGKHMYVDDLVTSELARSSGFGRKMIEWLRGVAREEECKYFHLDSGTHRGKAHKFYFRQGMEIASYHFCEPLA